MVLAVPQPVVMAVRHGRIGLNALEPFHGRGVVRILLTAFVVHLSLRAYEHKRQALARGDPVGGRWGRLYDKLVFSKIKAKLGGEVKYMISGAWWRVG